MQRGESGGSSLSWCRVGIVAQFLSQPVLSSGVSYNRAKWSTQGGKEGPGFPFTLAVPGMVLDVCETDSKPVF